MKRVAFWLLSAIVLVGMTTSLWATPYPIAAGVGGVVRWPALSAWVGADRDALAPPGGMDSWRDWVAASEGRSGAGLDVQPGPDDWALLAPIPYGPDEVFVDRISAGPSGLHALGNDSSGRDVASRLVHGTGTALWTAAIAVMLSALLGVTLGAVAGISAGGGASVCDFLIVRTIELFTCFPPLLLILCIAAFIDSSVLAIPLVLAAVYWATFARIVRGEVMSLREREWYQLADRGFRFGGVSLWVRHLWPEVRGRIAMTSAFVAASVIVAESTLRFLGLSGTGSVVSWGELAAQFRTGGTTAWHVWLFPCLAISVTVLALHALAGQLGVRGAVGWTAGDIGIKNLAEKRGQSVE